MEYNCNKDGEVYNSNGYKMKPYTHSDGYKQIKSYDQGCTESIYVHRMVWQTFMGDIPKGMEINHINEDKADNRLENLELVTQKENIRKRSYNKLSMEKCKSIQKQYIDKTHTTFASLAREYECHPTTISDCIKGKTWN